MRRATWGCRGQRVATLRPCCIPNPHPHHPVAACHGPFPPLRPAHCPLPNLSPHSPPCPAQDALWDGQATMLRLLLDVMAGLPMRRDLLKVGVGGWELEGREGCRY